MSALWSPWQRLYAWALRHRRSYWRTRAAGLGRPTVSVGNLHWGGSGKTPTVIAAARGLADRGLHVTVLSRGYRRKSSGSLVVSLGYGPQATVHQAGDEPLMIAEQTAASGGAVAAPVAVVVGADRRIAADLALAEAPATDIFLLDDAFSHVRVHRDVDVLTFPASDPFDGGRLFPGGGLREPLEHARLADAVVLTGLLPEDDPPASFEPTLRGCGFTGPVFRSRLEARVVGGSTAGRPLLVTGIARPGRVARTAAAVGLDPDRHLRFPDHHPYPSRSLQAILGACNRYRADAVLTTSKDLVKIRDRWPAEAPPLLELRVEAAFDADFPSWLAERAGLAQSRQ